MTESSQERITCCKSITTWVVGNGLVGWLAKRRRANPGVHTGLVGQRNEANERNAVLCCANARGKGPVTRQEGKQNKKRDGGRRLRGRKEKVEGGRWWIMTRWCPER